VQLSGTRARELWEREKDKTDKMTDKKEGRRSGRLVTRKLRSSVTPTRLTLIKTKHPANCKALVATRQRPPTRDDGEPRKTDTKDIKSEQSRLAAQLRQVGLNKPTFAEPLPGRGSVLKTMEAEFSDNGSTFWAQMAQSGCERN
jgi:hypothetical protein